MIAWISNWISGIIVSVILATIIEMLLPNGNNKKYIKVIIGLFILFSIIGPILSKFTNISIGQGINISTLNENKLKNEVMPQSTNQELEKIYKTNLEKDMKEKLQTKGYQVQIMALSVNLVEGENYGEINAVSIKVKETVKEEIKNTNTNRIVINEVKEINISVENTVQQKKEPQINEKTREAIKTYLSEEYHINKQNVNVN